MLSTGQLPFRRVSALTDSRVTPVTTESSERRNSRGLWVASVVSVPERPLSAGLTRRIALSGCAEDGSSGSGRFLAGLWAICHPALHPMWHFGLVPAERLGGLVPGSGCGTLPGERACWPSGRGDPCWRPRSSAPGSRGSASASPSLERSAAPLGAPAGVAGMPPSGKPWLPDWVLFCHRAQALSLSLVRRSCSRSRLRPFTMVPLVSSTARPWLAVCFVNEGAGGERRLPSVPPCCSMHGPGQRCPVLTAARTGWCRSLPFVMSGGYRLLTWLCKVLGVPAPLTSQPHLLVFPASAELALQVVDPCPILTSHTPSLARLPRWRLLFVQFLAEFEFL